VRKLIAPAQLQTKGIMIGDDQRRHLEEKGLFPKRVAVTSRTHGYVEVEVDQWIESRIAARDASAENVEPVERQPAQPAAIEPPPAKIAAPAVKPRARRRVRQTEAHVP
jgi:hypothetical protein